MTQRTVEIQTADGTSPAALSIPDGKGPWPAVLMFADAGGLRDATSQMGERLSEMGYVVLVPNFYYRLGPFDPPNMRTLRQNKEEMEKVLTRARGYTSDLLARDAESWADYLDSLPEKKPGGIGITGYCIGGRMALLAAAVLGQRVKAVAAFHPSGIVREEVPDSPHHRVSSIKATVYVAPALGDEDHGWTESSEKLFRDSLTRAGVDHTIETYSAYHGFAIPDQADHDEAADERHWQATKDLFASSLGS